MASERAPVLQRLDEDSEIIASVHPNILAKTLTLYVNSDEDNERVERIRGKIIATSKAIAEFKNFSSHEDPTFQAWAREIASEHTSLDGARLLCWLADLNRDISDPRGAQSEASFWMQSPITGLTKKTRKNLYSANEKAALVLIYGERKTEPMDSTDKL